MLAAKEKLLNQPAKKEAAQNCALENTLGPSGSEAIGWLQLQPHAPRGVWLQSLLSVVQ